MPEDNSNDSKLSTAYLDAYKEVETANTAILGGLARPKQEFEKGKPKGAFGTLLTAQGEWKKASLKGNKKSVTDLQSSERKEVSSYLDLRIAAMKEEIEFLKSQMPSSKVLLPEVLDENVVPIAESDTKRDPGELYAVVSILVFD